MKLSVPDPPHTEALAAFEEFTERQSDFFSASVDAIGKQVASVSRRVTSGTIKMPRSRTLARLTNALEAAGEWMVVMFVTATEAYLTDVLAVCAAVDTKLMEQSAQKASYADVLDATDIEELAVELRRRWARNFVDDGGPRRWIDRLTRMGARGYSDDLPDILEEAWGIRHMVVHTGARATRDFVKRHPNAEVQVRERVRVSAEAIGRYREAIWTFVHATDEFVVQRYPPASV